MNDHAVPIRVLLIAESCNPEWVSVPLEGWSHAQAISRIADVHLVTQVRNREALERAGLKEEVEFTAIDSERVARPIYRLSRLLRGGTGQGWTTVMAMSALPYYYFEHLVWRQFGGRIFAHDFDVVHRLTPLSPTVPSIIAQGCRRAGVPFIMGPLNGGVPWPRAFSGLRRREKEWLSYVRGLHKLMPAYRASRKYASAIIAGSTDVWRQLQSGTHRKRIYIPENGIDPARFPIVERERPHRPVRFIFVGRLVPYKGADMLIEAAAPLLREGRAKLKIVGDGPERERLHALARREQADVEFTGWVEHKDLQRHLLSADVFTFPSIREFGGAAVLEAMAVGLVPVIADYAGPAELVTDATGFRIPVSDRGAMIRDLRDVLTDIADNPDDRLVDRSRLAMRRARLQFSWDAKAHQVLEVYRWVLRQRPERPDFGMPLRDPADDLPLTYPATESDGRTAVRSSRATFEPSIDHPEQPSAERESTEAAPLPVHPD